MQGGVLAWGLLKGGFHLAAAGRAGKGVEVTQTLVGQQCVYLTGGIREKWNFPAPALPPALCIKFLPNRPAPDQLHIMYRVTGKLPCPNSARPLQTSNPNRKAQDLMKNLSIPYFVRDMSLCLWIDSSLDSCLSPVTPHWSDWRKVCDSPPCWTQRPEAERKHCPWRNLLWAKMSVKIY